ncbi:CBS domain-containing protein [Nocardia sp. CDC153]|uniref:restriction system modified-DNA reader domain-containing protein n=1 Tax=Nocardia sp. CDC153 TaxID=3112167 RepID=UPI002DBA189D|nr:CBS domain-containing protein [Nocardia sp. CDC153]MEC3955155.1 CBS domain-containing protein [Nocardia sp. CDC153]
MAGGAETERDDEAAARSMYLIGGRRVTVSDLLEAGLIRVGEALRFRRSRIGVTYDATVTESGLIRLEAGGEEFRSPSRAAMVAAGMRAVDGWRAWLVVDQDRMLDTVRQELLDRVISRVAAEANQRNEDSERRRIHDRLRQARKRADEHAPERISVRDLLALWGASDRGDQVSRIEADLANHGLTTSPSFRAVTLDTPVWLTTPPSDSEDAATTDLSGTEAVPADEDDEGGRDLDVRLTVGNLSPLQGVESVGPNSTLQEAITRMELNDYSQLAVLSGPRNLRGAVTWRSIAQAMHRKASVRLADAIDAQAEVVDYDRDLFEVLGTLQQRDFVFVRDESKAIAGIVTTADVAQRYGQMAMPFFHLGELDQTLRWILNRALDFETVQRLCNRRISSVDQLTFGDYRRVLENKEAWDRLGWPLDRASFICRLEEIRNIRNKVMHFHPDPIPEDAVDKLRRFNKLLHRYRERA